MSKPLILVTGAAGMVGSHVARRAVEAGYPVRCMVRPTSRCDALDGLDVTLCEADLLDPTSLQQAVRDVEVIVHAAAKLGDWGPAQEYRAVNVEGLRSLLDAAGQGTKPGHHGQLRRWVQISSLGVYPARHHHGTDETAPADREGFDGYTQTKAEAEVILERSHQQTGLPAVLLRPGFLYGPGDRHVVPRLVEQIAKGRMKRIGDGKKLLNNTYVGNLVDAVMLAIEREEAVGEIFNIRDGRLVDRNECIDTVARYLGKPIPGRVPEWLARGAVGWFERIAHLRGSKTAPMLTKTRIKFMTLNLDFSIEKAQQLLGYAPQVDFQEGMRETLDWLSQEGLLETGAK
jgi:nucleoside-diphosphate-sugar epimerase